MAARKERSPGGERQMNRNKRQEADGREGRKETESGRREAKD